MRYLARILMLGALVLLANPIWAAPSISITKMPDYGKSGYLEGKVSGVRCSDYRVAVVIRVSGLWWTKPSYSSPVAKIDSRGKWKVDVDTGGTDIYASRFYACLIKKSYPIPLYKGASDQPNIPQAAAWTTKDRPKPVRTISFAGDEWIVKAPEGVVDPGPMSFTDDDDRVWVDKSGIHLKMVKEYGFFAQGAEVYGKKSYGYGRYRFSTHNRLDVFDPWLVFGAFIFDYFAAYPYREIDAMEAALWGITGIATNCQYAIQPADSMTSPNVHRFKLSYGRRSSDQTTIMEWTPGRVEWRTYRGKYIDSEPPASNLVASWVKTGSAVPVPGKETFHFNLWLCNGKGFDYSGNGAEVIVTGFKFEKIATPPTPLPTPPALIPPKTYTMPTIFPIAFSDAGEIVYGTTKIDVIKNQTWSYLMVDGGWWTKPSFATPSIPIKSDGSLVFDCTTGGNDDEGTDLLTYVLPKEKIAPEKSGGSAVPEVSGEIALAHVELDGQRSEQQISWNGGSSIGQIGMYGDGKSFFPMPIKKFFYPIENYVRAASGSVWLGSSMVSGKQLVGAIGDQVTRAEGVYVWNVRGDPASLKKYGRGLCFLVGDKYGENSSAHIYWEQDNLTLQVMSMQNTYPYIIGPNYWTIASEAKKPGDMTLFMTLSGNEFRVRIYSGYWTGPNLPSKPPSANCYTGSPNVNKLMGVQAFQCQALSNDPVTDNGHSWYEVRRFAYHPK